MKLLRTVLLIAALGSLAGCVVVPDRGYYGGGYSHYYGGWHERDRY